MAREVFAVNHTITGGRSFAAQDVITYRVQYPEFVSYTPIKSLTRLNTYYRDSALALGRNFLSVHDADALADYNEHQRRGAAFYGYEMVRAYSLAYGQDCVVSLYLDEYTYTGGAHGDTVRSSDTWNALTGERLALATLFPQGFGYAELLKGLIAEEIARRNAAEPGSYAEGKLAVVEKAFDESHFYLTPGELVIYFQQYEIAPYSTGIPAFAFPYGLVGASVPKCG